MREGISELRSMGTLFSQLGLFARLADAFARCGNVDDGLAVIECPSSDDLRHIAGFQKGGSGSSAVEIMRRTADGANDDWRLFVV
jgi:hypothetical protein